MQGDNAAVPLVFQLVKQPVKLCKQRVAFLLQHHQVGLMRAKRGAPRRVRQEGCAKKGAPRMVREEGCAKKGAPRRVPALVRTTVFSV